MKEETIEHVFADFKEYKDYLDQGPNDDWIQERSLGTGKPVHLFLPLFIIQGQADFIFREWHVIEEKPLSISNGVACTVKIMALPDYPSAEHITFTGTAAIMFKSANNAVEFDLPNARERAVGKAFSTLGNVFGRNLNRTYKINRVGKEEKATVSKDFSFRDKTEKE